MVLVSFCAKRFEEFVIKPLERFKIAQSKNAKFKDCIKFTDVHKFKTQKKITTPA